jgi:hypothetical protein
MIGSLLFVTVFILEDLLRSDFNWLSTAASEHSIGPYGWRIRRTSPGNRIFQQTPHIRRVSEMFRIPLIGCPGYEANAPHPLGLSGDSVDDIPGAPGIEEKGA